MGTPTEIIYARVPVTLQLGQRIKNYIDAERAERWTRISIGDVVGQMLDKSLPPIAPPKPERKKPAKKAAKGKRGRRANARGKR